MKTNRVISFMVGFVLTWLIINAIKPKEPQGRLIKPFPKDITEVPYDPDCYQCNPDTICGWCGTVKAYSLNVNVHHYGDSLN